MEIKFIEKKKIGMRLNLDERNVFFTSDTHYNHTNICRGVSRWAEPERSRDFKTLERMNGTIVDNLNRVVGQDDILFHLGDWSFGGFDSILEFRKRIVCQNIHLVLGNHDHHIRRNKEGIQDAFSSVSSGISLLVVEPPLHLGKEKHRKTSFELSHFPIASWEGLSTGTIHLHGHVHLGPGEKFSKGRALDVGVDGNDFQPYSLREILRMMRHRPFASLSLPSDHHEYPAEDI